MSDELKVYVVAFGDRAQYQLQWKCPNTGKKKTRSSGIVNDGKAKSRQDAERKAANLEAGLRANYTVHTRHITWAQFRERYEKEKGLSLANRSAESISSLFNIIEEILNPQKLSQLTEERISYFAATMRERGKTEATIKGRLAYLKAALRWAEKMKLLNKAPAIVMPGRAADKSKGRPITGEEFDRMLAAVDKVVGIPDNHPKDKPLPVPTPAIVALRAAWKRYLKGLYYSGLRAGEAVCLSWDNERKIRVDLTGKRPMLHIPAAMEKGNKDRILPITPDFASLLLETPEAERRGRVFKLPAKDGKNWLEEDKVSKTVSAIGEKAGIVVSPAHNGKPAKYASSHDLRRSFGERWAAKVMPQVLQEMMRHDDISTTMRFYVGQNAERAADAIWAAFEKGNTLANSPKSTDSEKPKKQKNPR